MFGNSDSNTRRMIIGAVGVVALGLASIAPTASSFAVDQNHKVYSFYNNEFIVREQSYGNRRSLSVYRLTGDQWEREGGSAQAKRILREGRYLGRVRVDLDNPLNTDLNLGGGSRL